MEERRMLRGRQGSWRWRRRTPSSSRAAGAALRRKVRELRRLVPGAEEAPAGALLLRAADYVARLRARVELLRALAELYGVGGAATTPQVADDCADADADACASY